VGNRTPDLLITSEPLCHLSYVGAKEVPAACRRRRSRGRFSLEAGAEADKLRRDLAPGRPYSPAPPPEPPPGWPVEPLEAPPPG
jgi:hypothetical protein